MESNEKDASALPLDGASDGFVFAKVVRRTAVHGYLAAELEERADGTGELIGLLGDPAAVQPRLNKENLSPSARALFESHRIDVVALEPSPAPEWYAFRDARGEITENEFAHRYREVTSAHDLDEDAVHPRSDLFGGAYLTGLGVGGIASALVLDDKQGAGSPGATAVVAVAIAATVAGLLWGGGALMTWNGATTDHRLTWFEAELYAARYNRALLRSAMGGP